MTFSAVLRREKLLRQKYKAFFSALFFFCTATLSACGKDDGSGYIFKYDITENPSTLDPQTATGGSAEMIISNAFQGLFRVAENGSIENRMAESFEVSDNGLVYTFSLRQNVYWTYDGDSSIKCTAKDYAYAFERLFNPSNKAARASEFYCIKNAERISSGVISDYSQLGIKAIGDYTLEITLSEPYPQLLALLAETPAMPCNEEIYKKTEGRYGLEADYTASNGSFYVFSWSYDQWSSNNNVIIMRRNAKNSESERVYPYGLNFFINAADKYKDFTEGVTHTYVSEGKETAELIKAGYDFNEYSTSVWGVLFNTETVFTNNNIRKALAFSLDREQLVMPGGFTATDNIIPDGVWLLDSLYRELAGDSAAYAVSKDKAKEMYLRGAAALGGASLTGTEIIVPEGSESAVELLKSVLQQWQADFNFYCGIDVKSEREYYSALEGGNFKIALVRLSGSSGSPAAYLGGFVSSSSENYSSFGYSEYEAILKKAHGAEKEQSAELYRQAEEYVLSSAVFVPLANQTEYVFFGKKCADISYNPYSGIILYGNAKSFD